MLTSVTLENVTREGDFFHFKFDTGKTLMFRNTDQVQEYIDRDKEPPLMRRLFKYILDQNPTVPQLLALSNITFSVSLNVVQN